jgi:Zn(II)-responsive transcriptional regulator
MNRIKRGELAKSAGVGIEAVRFYEKKGLLPKARRSGAGYREFTDEDVSRIQFVKRAQELGFSLREIKELMDLNANTRVTCSDMRGRADMKIQEIETKIEDLKKMRRSLKRLAEACGESKKAAAQCQIMNCFETGWRC